MGGTINLPTRQQWAVHNRKSRKSTRHRLLANLLLVKMGAFHRMLNSEFWVRRLDDAERALDSEWASALGEPVPYEPLNPPPTGVELLLWRPEAEAAFRIADKLDRALTADPKWVRVYPEVVAFSYEIVQRTRDVLTHIDQLLLELDIIRAYQKAGPDHHESLGTGSELVRRPSTAPGHRHRKGNARKYDDDTLPESPMIH